MDYSQQAQTSHYAAPPTYYLPSSSTSATISPIPNPNPNPSFDQVPVSVPQGVDASLTSLVGCAVPQYEAATYASYEASISGSAGGVALSSPYFGSMPTVGPIHQVKKTKANHVVSTQALEAKKQKLIETGADANSVHTCNICNVVCNSDKVFASHIASEKHISRVNGEPSKGLAKTARSNLNKKLKMKTTNSLSVVRAPTVVQSVYCDICKITCNTQEMYKNHVTGKKHHKNIKNHTAGDGLIEFVPARQTSPGGQAPCKNYNEKSSVYCDVCQVTCDTLVMYSNHVAGKKHNKNIKKLTMGDTLIQTVPATSTLPGTQTPATNDNDQEHVHSSSEMAPKTKVKRKSVAKEDLETKKQKMLEGGANGDAVKVCNLCNIVCNSPKVFEYHCMGQKHRSMIKKQEENLGASAVAHHGAALAVVSAQMTAAPS